MALRRCLRTDFLLGFRHQIADALDCTGIELLDPSIGDQSPFDEALSHRPRDQSNQRPRDERASADRYASNEVAAVHLRRQAAPSPSPAKLTPLLSQYDRFVSTFSIASGGAHFSGEVRSRCLPARIRLPRSPHPPGRRRSRAGSRDQSTTPFSVKSEPGPPITLGGAAAAHARLVV
jgi:hypothetical protein